MKNFKIKSVVLSRVVLLVLLVIFFSQCTPKPKEETKTAQTQDSGTPVSDRPAHWGYEGDDGPANWKSLSPAYALCGEGKHQSPVNIVKSDVKGGAVWKLDYKATSLRIAHNQHMDEIINNGHTIQVTVDEGSTFAFGDKTYDLKQFHFHTPSEHTVDGKHAPMEMHMVHQGDDGGLAVISILFQESDEPNKNFEKLIANLPNAKGESKHITDEKMELQLYMPKDNYAYHYVGSLTTPPCSEDVQWLVLRDPVYLTAKQIDEFSSRIGNNNRPTQELNDRTIKEDDLLGNIQQ